MLQTDLMSSYIGFVGQVRHKYLRAQVTLISFWNGLDKVGNRWQQGGASIDEIQQAYAHQNKSGRAHYFNTVGILQHNDIVSDVARHDSTNDLGASIPSD